MDHLGFLLLLLHYLELLLLVDVDFFKKSLCLEEELACEHLSREVRRE
jgi:hypothetical protein